MIEKIAIWAVEAMEKEGFLKAEKRAHYLYAFETMLERTITIVTIILISILMNNLISTIIFLSFFFSLRKRTGGYHANTFQQCYLCTIIVYIAIIFLNPIWSQNYVFLVGSVTIAAFLILKIGTINHPNMDLEINEILEMQKSTKYLLFLECSFICISMFINLNSQYIGYMSEAIVLCALLQLLAKLLKQETTLNK